MHYAMSSNYNRIRKPAVVFVQNGQADEVVRRESHQDIVHCDTIPERMKSELQSV